MKTKLDYLPQEKQEELSRIVALIEQTQQAEMVILFGSYARDDWVEDKYDNTHYRYQSDMDMLVIVETKSEFAQGKLERDIAYQIEQDEKIKTPVSLIVHDIDFMNRRLKKAQYFFTDIKKEGVLLFDTGKYQLCESKELLPEERKKLAQEDFEYWFTGAKEFLIDFQHAFERGSYAKAAFELHQAAERLYSGILLVFTRYKPNTHDLSVLRKLTNSTDNRFAQIFTLEDSENRRLFDLLRKAYVDARYKRNYAITKEELEQLAHYVVELQTVGQTLCQEKITSFVMSKEDKAK